MLYEVITVDFTKVTPIYSPHYKVLENGEAEYIAWISERKLDTNIAVKLPFRVDIEFLAEEKSEQYLWGTNEGSMWFSHNNLFYILNDENYADQALKKHAINRITSYNVCYTKLLREYRVT